MQCSVFNLPFQIAIYTRVITATMLFLQFNSVAILRWYGIQKNEYHKCGIKHVVNPLTLNCLNFPHCLHLHFMQACVYWVLIIFGTQVIKKKRPVLPVFPDYLSVSYDDDLIYIFCNTMTMSLQHVKPGLSIFTVVSYHSRS